MAVWPSFVGPAYRSQSPTAATDRCINWYPESLEKSGEVKAKSALYPTPGLELLLTLPTGPVSQLFSINGRAFAVADTGFYELFAGGTYTLRGNVQPSAGRASMASNGTAGNQILVISGGQGYILDTLTNAFGLITDVNFPAGQAVNGWYADGYFVVQVEGTTTFQLSNLNDGTAWGGLSVAQRLFGQDIISAIVVSHRELVILGTQTSEVWYNSGATFP